MPDWRPTTEDIKRAYLSKATARRKDNDEISKFPHPPKEFRRRSDSLRQHSSA